MSDKPEEKKSFFSCCSCCGEEEKKKEIVIENKDKVPHPVEPQPCTITSTIAPIQPATNSKFRFTYHNPPTYK